MKTDVSWHQAESALLEAARDVSAPYITEARQAMTTQALQQSLEEPNIEPRVQIQIAQADQFNLILRLPVPVRKRGRLEQDISRRYLCCNVTVFERG